ncbi:MAG: HNH endonuclease [Thiotrichaceae bacterium]|nr:HNH endonuclease [Thiotrichaceae bacterium]
MPWRKNEKRRADPTNGIALNARYDKAFDRGLITFDEKIRVVISSVLKRSLVDSPGAQKLFEIEGCGLILPGRFRPDEAALAYHRDVLFQKG